MFMPKEIKLLTWNCNGAFRNKFHLLSHYECDLLIIQECENPEFSKSKKYRDWANNYIWVGDNKNKGLGIFAKDNIKLKKLDWSADNLKYFIPVIINDRIQLLATWCHGANSPTFGYIGQLWKYMQLHQSKFKNQIICGDFNSNVIWDKWDRWWNHSDVIRDLSKANIRSLYHEHYREDAGKETKPTFFHRKALDKSYHIDYVFGSNELIKKIDSFEIMKPDEWLEFSDHMPIICFFKI